MQTKVSEVTYDEVLWECDDCQVWWASQTKTRPTDLLLQLPHASKARFPWDAFRGWRLKYVSQCPQCDQAQDVPAYAHK